VIISAKPTPIEKNPSPSASRAARAVIFSGVSANRKRTVAMTSPSTMEYPASTMMRTTRTGISTLDAASMPCAMPRATIAAVAAMKIA
jgi:hypothetical protein